MRQIKPVLRQGESKRIAVLLNHELGYCRRVLSGILRYAEGRSDWILRDGPPDVALLEALAKWRPDGVIAHLVEGHLAVALERMQCPVVSTTATLNREDLAVVDVDNVAVGREAGRYFLGRGFRNFAYFGSGTARFSQERKQGFEEEVGARGFEVSSLHAQFLPQPTAAEIWRPLGERVESWLRGLKKPVALFCSNDIPARRIAELCGQAKIVVPGEIAILGVDNDTSECRLARPQLSSIETPAEQVGHRAAEVLASLMAGEELAAKVQPPVHVITRASTDRWASQDEVVRRAMGFIREETAMGVGVEAVARNCGVSRRQLERVFQRELGMTVLGVIQDQRIDLARALLVSTKLPVSVVSERSGFSDPKRMRVLFRERLGMSPREFRVSLSPEA